MVDCGQILLVEDPSDIARLYPLFLKLGKYQVTTARTLAVAADFSSATAFDLLICDPWLPDGDAYSLLRVARQYCPSIRAILVTPNLVSWTIEAALASGFSACLAKPPTHERLGSVVERVLSGPEEPLLALSG